MGLASVVRAVDIGYGWTKYVERVDGNHVHTASFPSIAPRAAERHVSEALGQKRNTVEIGVGNHRFEVGPDSHLARGDFYVRNQTDDYCMSPEYLALVRGTLAYMNVPNIDLLVVGLPVSTFGTRRKDLQKLLEGDHVVANGRAVTVREVVVLAQPHGSLVAHAVDTSRFDQLQRQRTLVIDCGSRTFDWLLAQGFKVIDAKSHSVNRGMLHVLQAIADSVGVQLGERFNDLDRIDRALRLKEPLYVAGRPFDLQAHIDAAAHIAANAVQELRNRLDVQDDSSTSIDNIVVSGGGSFFFGDAIGKAFPRHQLRMMKNAMYSNVRGFQFVGMDLLRNREQARELAASTETKAS